MMQSSCVCLRYWLVLLLALLAAVPAAARQFTEADCRPLEDTRKDQQKSLPYGDAVLWKVSKDDRTSHIFGTIHVADPAVTNLPEPVSDRFNSADIFVMEALPTPEESLKLSQMMFFTDGRSLRDYIDETLFDRTASVLATHELPAASVMFMKPWAAFLLMNYPAETGLPLDLVLLNRARENGVEAHGLESLTEQGDVFSRMDMDKQVRFLLDTVCNYDVVQADFEKLKKLYLRRDLEELYIQSNKYSLSDEKIYQELVKKLLTDRNRLMADRMQSLLGKGNAFVAIGAMHLPGKDGVLALLAEQGYSVTPVY